MYLPMDEINRQTNMFRLFAIGILWSTISISISAQTDSLFFKALGFLHYHRYDSSAYYLKTILQTDPSNTHYQQTYATVLSAQKKWQEALAIYKNLNSNNRYYKLSRLYALLDDTAKSFFYLKKVLQQKEHTPLVVLQSDSAFAKIKTTPQWDSLFENHQDKPYQELINQIAYDTNYQHYTQAIETIDTYLKQHPQKHFLYYLEGVILESQHDTAGALPYFKKAFDLKSQTTTYRLAFARSLITNKKYKKAIAILSYFTQHKTYQAIFLKWLGIAYFKTKKWNQAVFFLKRYTQFFYNDDEAYFLLAQAYTNIRQRQNALLAINKAIKCNTKNTSSYIKFRGKLYVNMKIYRMALIDLRNTLDIHPDDGESYLYLGLAYHGIGNKRDACRALEKAVDLQFMEANKYRLKFCH